MQKAALLWVFAIASVVGCKKDSADTAVPSGQPIPATTILPATYADTSGATDNVKSECQLEEKLAAYIVEAAPGSSLGSSAGAGRVLQVQIATVIGAGGGAWSGNKTLEVSGTLTDGPTTLGTFRGRRSTGGGAWGGYKGTCSLLQRDAKALGSDIADWLAAPSMDAKLGEL